MSIESAIIERQLREAEEKRERIKSKFLREVDGGVDITLSQPVILPDGSKSSVVRMREPTSGEVEAMQRSKEPESEKELKLFAALCMLTPDDVRKLPLRNYERMQVAYGLFTD